MDALARFGVDEPLVAKALGEILGHEVDDADLYFEHVTSEGLALEEGQVKKAARSVHQGVGVRAVAGDRTGYAHSDAIDGPRLVDAARAARAISRDRSGGQVVALGSHAASHDLYPVARQAVDEGLEDKLALLEAMDARARAHDPRIEQVFANVACELRHVAVVRADGRVVFDERPLVRLNISCIAVEGQNRQVGSAGGGGRFDFETLAREDEWASLVDEAARRAVLNLSAVDSPAGEMDVVLGPGWPGILLHEAIGHGLEGDFNRKGTSAFSGLLGKQVASPLVTVVDDGTLPGRRGSLNVDDEGNPTRRTVLIEDGILRGYMQDRLNARLMGMEVTGNGRRESYASVPMPRMTNTFMLAGEDDPEDIIRSVKRGIYAVAFGGGQVDITSGKFVFSGSEAWLIEDGRVTVPVKGATFIGNGPDVLTRVSAVGHDLQLDRGVGTCGKDGQSVPVGVGMPTIRIDRLTVGGVST
ncbi:MAG: metalloprotease TldD [Deltaproteobacteria bacterium]|nr:metalloprotease TldD [Deltaproteobacteria bacterium]MCB9788267.1 metalloprotease TldD [Deltaproteobacteria bacterium]